MYARHHHREILQAYYIEMKNNAALKFFSLCWQGHAKQIICPIRESVLATPELYRFKLTLISLNIWRHCVFVSGGV